MIDPDWPRVDKLTSVIRAAGFEGSSVFLMDAPPGLDGMNNSTNNIPDAFVARRLTDPEAEATALHELSHVALGHNEDPAYEEARRRDEAEARDHYRASWEIDANASLAALSEDIGRFTQ